MPYDYKEELRQLVKERRLITWSTAPWWERCVRAIEDEVRCTEDQADEAEEQRTSGLRYAPPHRGRAQWEEVSAPESAEQDDDPCSDLAAEARRLAWELVDKDSSALCYSPTLDRALEFVDRHYTGNLPQVRRRMRERMADYFEQFSDATVDAIKRDVLRERGG